MEFEYRNFTDISAIVPNFKTTEWRQGAGPPCCDAMFKYHQILENIELTTIEAGSLLEPGCAASPLAAFITHRYGFKNAYLFDYEIVSGENIHNTQKRLFENNLNCTLGFYGGDFYKNIENVPDNSIDLIIDGCSVTHFCGNDSVHNSGVMAWTKIKDVCDKKLKQNGCFIISTDVKYNKDITKFGSNGEFIYPKDILDIFSKDYQIINPILSNDTIDNVLPYSLRVMSVCFKRKN